MGVDPVAPSNGWGEKAKALVSNVSYYWSTDITRARAEEVEQESEPERQWRRTRGQVRTYRTTWQGRSPAEGRVEAAMVSNSCTRGFSSGVLALQGSEQREHTADVIHEIHVEHKKAARRRQQRQKSRAEAVSGREHEAGQKGQSQTGRVEIFQRSKWPSSSAAMCDCLPTF